MKMGVLVKWCVGFRVSFTHNLPKKMCRRERMLMLFFRTIIPSVRDILPISCNLFSSRLFFFSYLARHSFSFFYGILQSCLFFFYIFGLVHVLAFYNFWPKPPFSQLWLLVCDNERNTCVISSKTIFDHLQTHESISWETSR